MFTQRLRKIINKLISSDISGVQYVESLTRPLHQSIDREPWFNQNNTSCLYTQCGY